MITPAIEKLENTKVRIRGYILPSFQQSGLTQFVLVRDNMQCCFGPARRCSIALSCKWTPAKPPNSPPTRWPSTAFSPSANSAARKTSAWPSTHGRGARAVSKKRCQEPYLLIVDTLDLRRTIRFLTPFFFRRPLAIRLAAFPPLPPPSARRLLPAAGRSRLRLPFLHRRKTHARAAA